jgi:hypothetical protein
MLPLVVHALDDLAVAGLEELSKHISITETLIPGLALASFENALDSLDIIGVPRPDQLGQYLCSYARGEPKRRFDDLQIVWIVSDADQMLPEHDLQPMCGACLVFLDLP